MSAHPKEIVRQLVETINSRDLDKLSEIVSEDYRQHNPMVPTGLQGLKGFLGQLQAAFPDSHNSVQGLLAEGDRVASMTAIAATHRGEIMGIPPTGRQVTIQAIDVWRVADGKLAEHWDALDTLGFLRQLGAIPGSDAEEVPNQFADEITIGSGNPEANKSLIRRFYETVWSGGSLDLSADFLDANMIVHSPLQFPGREPGAAGAVQGIVLVRGAFPDLTRTIEDQMAEGDLVLTRFTDHGTHTGPFLQIPPTGKSVTVEGINIERLAGERVVEQWHIEDLAGLMRQLGVA